MRLIDVDTAALAWDVSVRTIRRWIAEGKLTDHGTNGRTLLDLDEKHERSAAGRKPRCRYAA